MSLDDIGWDAVAAEEDDQVGGSAGAGLGVHDRSRSPQRRNSIAPRIAHHIAYQDVPGCTRWASPCFRALHDFRVANGLIEQFWPIRCANSCGGSLADLVVWKALYAMLPLLSV